MHTCLALEDDVFWGNMAVLAFHFPVFLVEEWKFQQKMFPEHHCPSEVNFVFKLSVWECRLAVVQINMFSNQRATRGQPLFTIPKLLSGEICAERDDEPSKICGPENVRTYNVLSLSLSTFFFNGFTAGLPSIGLLVKCSFEGKVPRLCTRKPTRLRTLKQLSCARG